MIVKESSEQAKGEEEQAKQMKEMQKKMDKQKVDNDKVVAIVNDEKIKGEDFNNVLTSISNAISANGSGSDKSKDAAKQIKEQTIDSLVGQTLLLQQADKKGYKASDDEMDKQLEEVKKQYKDDKNSSGHERCRIHHG